MKGHNHFEGWYFKQQADCGAAAFIPARHADGGGVAASLQIVTDAGTHCVPYDARALSVDRRGPRIVLGRNVFSPKGLHLDVHAAGAEVFGDLVYQNPVRLPYDIMGPFCRVPFMECRHSVFSMRHDVSGHLTVNGREMDFSGGAGYIEGDRGRSFPKRYLWTQCCFPEGSLMLSAADIPFPGGVFTGIIGVVYFHGRQHRLATYLGARLLRPGERAAVVRQGAYMLEAALLSESGTLLRAPVRGGMTRLVRESLVCRAAYRFSKSGETLFDFVTDRASFEYEYGS
ncbi:MAG TPA: hypothetical protein PK597_03540 [Oscillospiraceae bacterium]|nr:hypothetical protein [Oscillospiraceae bacterium]